MAEHANKIEVSLELARELVPILEDQIKGLDNDILNYESQRDSKARTLAELRARLNGNAASIAGNGARKRLRKGQGEKIVCDLLKSISDGQGLGIAEIVAKTGVSYSNTYRILTKNNKGRFDNIDGLWSLKKKWILPEKF